MAPMDQFEDDGMEYTFIRDNDDYKRYSDAIFYEFIGDRLVRALSFERHRMYDTKVECIFNAPGPGKDYAQDWIIRMLDSENRVRTDIRKSETCRIMEEYLLNSVHLPIGCTDETTPLGKYWTFNDEIYISDPCPPLMDWIGIQDWTIVGGCPECEGRLTGNLREAMERYNQSKMFEVQMMIDDAFKKILSGKDESDDVPHINVPCHLIADSYPNLVFTFPNGFLEVYEGDKLILWMPISKMDHFTQNRGD